MNTIVVIAPHSDLAAAVRAALDPSLYRVIEQTELSEDELRLSAASIDACICEVDLTTVQPIRTIERLRQILPRCPLILYAADSDWKWEEEAYLLGVSQILAKPVRARLLNAVLARLPRRPGAPEYSRCQSRPSAPDAARGGSGP